MTKARLATVLPPGYDKTKNADSVIFSVQEDSWVDEDLCGLASPTWTGVKIRQVMSTLVAGSF